MLASTSYIWGGVHVGPARQRYTRDTVTAREWVRRTVAVHCRFPLPGCRQFYLAVSLPRMASRFKSKTVAPSVPSLSATPATPSMVLFSRRRIRAVTFPRFTLRHPVISRLVRSRSLPGRDAASAVRSILLHGCGD